MAYRHCCELFRSLGDNSLLKTLLFATLLLAQSETISPDILRQLQMLDGGYRSPWYREAMLYRRSFQTTLKEIEAVLGEEGCYSEQLIISQLIAEFDVDETPMERILEMNQEVGKAIGRCYGRF